MNLSRSLGLLVLLCGVGSAQVCGDCDGDGSLGVTDAFQSAVFALGRLTAPPDRFDRCDGDGDGAITVLDALRIAQAAVGLSPALSCRGPRDWRLVKLPDLDPRQYSLLTFDALRRRVMLLGGYAGVWRSDLWAWNGVEWQLLAVDESASDFPSPWTGLAMTYDSGRDVVVLVGMNTSFGLETWEWNGGWVRRTPASSPPGRWGTSVAFDSLRGATVMFGGENHADTWEWDGTSWTERSPTVSPPERSRAVMAFDPLRGRTVLFGGGGAAGALSDTWEWDGSSWTELAAVPPAVPDSSRLAGMVFDANVGMCALHENAAGGAGMQAWGWNGTSWQLLTTASMSQRSGHGLVFDSFRDRLLVVGGKDDRGVPSPSRPRNAEDTWVWDGASWTLAHEMSTPATTIGAVQVFDSVAGKTLLFGGRSGAANGDTWIWDGASWDRHRYVPGDPYSGEPVPFVFDESVERVRAFESHAWEWNGSGWQTVPGASAIPRFQAPAAFDVGSGFTTMFGGSLHGVPPDDTTWVFDGAWRQVFPPSAPPPREEHATVYDPRRREVVVFGGGTTAFGAYRSDTWVWDGSTWHERIPANRPPARWGASMTFDSRRGTVVLWGGAGIWGDMNDTWEWDGAEWHEIVTATHPPAGMTRALSYDSVRGAVVLYDGIDPLHTFHRVPTRAVWELR